MKLIASFKEANWTFLTPEWSQDIFLLQVSSSRGQMKQHITSEAHNMPGYTPSPPCPCVKVKIVQFIHVKKDILKDALIKEITVLANI